MSDEELFAALSEISNEEIMARNPASIIEVGRRIEQASRRAALVELATTIADNWPDRKFGLPEIEQRIRSIAASDSDGGAA